MRVRGRFFSELVVDMISLQTQGILALYLVKSHEIGDERPSWSVCGFVAMLEDFKETS